MAWNSAGSLSVTNGSAAVVGTGTSFLSAYAGDALVCAAGVFEILSITDNTHLTLATNYSGSTGTIANLLWRILPCSPLRSSVATVAASVSALIAAYSNLVVATGASTTITLNKTAAGNNNGIILQDNAVAIARLGTFGDDNLKLQVTWDGSTYVNGLTITRSAGADNGQVSLKAGTAAAPALVLNADGNTGLFQPVADALAWSIAGSEKMRLHTNGYLGIGSTNPSAPLTVSNTFTDPASALNLVNLTAGYVYTANNANQINGVSFNFGNWTVPAGVTLSGGYSAFRLDAFINNASFAGTMNSMIGFWNRTGILLSASTAVISNAECYRAEIRNDIGGTTLGAAFGFRVVPGTIAGNITNLYGFYMPAITVTGAITNRYGVRIEDTVAYNYFAGKLGVGAVNTNFALYVNSAGGTTIAANFTDSDTDSVNKTARLSYSHYLNAQAKICIAHGVSDTSNNTLSIGGGSSVMNTATLINFYTAANNTTLTGTLALSLNGSQQALHVLGAAATPSISFQGDTNTGVYSPAADTLGWVTGGTERGRVNSSGHFLLGTTVDNGVFTVGGNIMPDADNTRDLGSTTFRMHTIYAGTGTINTSDAREKSNIVDIREASRIVRALSPKSFKKYGEQRLGFLAQDVRRVLGAHGIGADTVKGDEAKGYLGLYEPDLIAPLWASHREVLDRLDALERRALAA